MAEIPATFRIALVVETLAGAPDLDSAIGGAARVLKAADSILRPPGRYVLLSAAGIVVAELEMRSRFVREVDLA